MSRLERLFRTTGQLDYKDSLDDSLGSLSPSSWRHHCKDACSSLMSLYGQWL